MSFQDDIQGKNTQLYPIVRIGNDIFAWEAPDEGHYQYYSTNNVDITEKWTIGGERSAYCKPILMNIPSIKESVDVESRKFKISNVSLQFNNFPFDGVRFSDQLSETSLINTEVNIYFKSPTADEIPSGNMVLFYGLEGTMNVNYIERVYKGIIRSISHDDEKVKVKLEDLTEQKTHKDLPQKEDQNGVVGYLGDDDSVPDKYKNEPIPMVYGKVDKSPLVIRHNYRNLAADSKIIKGFIEIDSGYKLAEENAEGNPIGIWLDSLQVDINGELLHIKRGGQYVYFSRSIGLLSKPLVDDLDEYSLTCRQIAPPRLSINNLAYSSDLVDEDYLDGSQYSIDNINAISDGSLDVNDIALVGKRTWTSWGTTGLKSNFESLLLTIRLSVHPQHDTVDGNNKIIGFRINGYNLPKFLGYQNLKAVHSQNLNGSYPSSDIVTHNDTSENYNQTGNTANNIIWSDNCHHDDIIENVFGFEYVGAQAGMVDYPVPSVGYDYTTAAIQLMYSNNSQTSFDSENTMEMPLILFRGGENNSLNIEFRVVSDFTITSTGETYEPMVEITGNINEIGLAVESKAIKLFNNNFYANVEGRINTDNATFGELNNTNLDPEELIENPIDIIYDLVRSEIGHGAIDENEYLEAKDAHDGWEFGFTINKKINSKKLIQEIAKSTKCFPKFKNDGTFGFNTIKDYYTVSNNDRTGDYETATLIRESEVISYSFKKTKSEQIYKKVDVQYNKDYAADSLLNRTDAIDLGADPYYGIESSSDAYLEFESDYIRQEGTANALAAFLSEQYRNDHLLFKLKLPLQYINLEVGGLVRFRRLFNGVKAYGIDYRIMENPTSYSPAGNDPDSWGQYYYPLFMVTSTTKNLDSVSIECMQLHYLGGGSTAENNAWLDFDEDGQFYFPDDGSYIVEEYIPEEEVEEEEEEEEVVGFAPDVVTDQYVLSEDSVVTDKVYVWRVDVQEWDVVGGGIEDPIWMYCLVTDDMAAFNFNDYDGYDDVYPYTDPDIFSQWNMLQIKSPTNAALVTVAYGHITQYESWMMPFHPNETPWFDGNLQVVWLSQSNFYANEPGGGTGQEGAGDGAGGSATAEHFPDAHPFTDTMDSFLNPEGWVSGDSLQPLEITRMTLNTSVSGDSNSDGVIDVLDIVRTVLYILGQEGESINPIDEQELANMDMNQDGIIDVLDVVTLVNQIIGT